MKNIIHALVLVVLLAGLAAMPVSGQVAGQSIMAYTPYSAQQLDQLLGPIALYPDPLIAQILPAATIPTQIVLAGRYLEDGGDPNAVDQQPWDPSVQAVAHYPQVLEWLNDNLAWTTALGQAFLNQQQDVMDSIQRLRAEAQSMGNLLSTPQQEVVTDNGQIEILPVNPDTIYVPQYSPDTVYYETATGMPFITFSLGFPIGVWLNCDFDWHGRRMVVWDHDHPRPPDWWHQPPAQRRDGLAHQVTVWHPGDRRGPGLVNNGDRGWDNHDRTPPQPQPARGAENHARPVETRPEATAPREMPRTSAPQTFRPQPAPAVRAPSSGNNTFIGIQNANDARAFSARGQQSRQFAAPHANPAPTRSSPPPRSSPPSGGGNNSGRGRR